MSYKPEVYVQGEWAGNGLRFTTEQEALNSARDLSARWFLVEAWRAAESADPVNYVYIGSRLLSLDDIAPATVASEAFIQGDSE